MTQEKGIPYQRHKPSAVLREFLDPLDPGSYFDCGRARLHGLDDALLKEAESRGRQVGDDSFQLVATDMGLIFCRPSISFAIAARWEEALLIRPHGDDPVILPVTWPTHGELKFTVSKRLAGNIFRRWLQLRMQAARQARTATAPRNMATPPSPEPSAAPGTEAERSDTDSSPILEDSGSSELVGPAQDVAGIEEPSTELERVQSDSDATDVVGPAEPSDEEWEVVANVEPPADPEPASESSVVERRDTGVSPKRKKLDERGAAKRRIDRQLLLATFEAETSVPVADEELDDGRQDEAGGSSAAELQEPETGPDGEPIDDEHAWPDQRRHRKAATVAASVVPPAVADQDADRETPLDAVIDLEASPPDDSVLEIAADEGTGETDGSADGRAPNVSDERVGEFHGGAIRTIAKPETTPPSWVGSPLSLVVAVVVVSSFVLITTLVASVYRGGGDDGTESANPAGPVVRTTIDHQRFKPGGESSVPLRSAALTPTGSSVVGSTVPDSDGTTAGIATSDRNNEPDRNAGTSNEPRLCNSNYSGCVADVSDVDCPGDGDGPVFAEGSAVVMGEDVYDLDTDGDGETCEPDQPRREALDESENADQESSTADLVAETP